MIFDLIVVVLITAVLTARFEWLRRMQLHRAQHAKFAAAMQKMTVDARQLGVAFSDMVPVLERAAQAMKRFGDQWQKDFARHAASLAAVPRDRA